MNTWLTRSFAVVGATVFLNAAPLQAQIVPAGTPGSHPYMTFGGSGIPTHSVMVASGDGVTLGISAAQRFSNPVVTNNGAGTFFAAAGVDPGSPPGSTYATWNFNWYISSVAAEDAHTFELLIDRDPAAGSAASFLIPSPLLTSEGFQNSWNLGMEALEFFGGDFNFDPTVNGEYGFALVARNVAGAEVARAAMLVQVGETVVPEPSTYVLMAAGLAGLGVVVRRRRTVVG